MGQTLYVSDLDGTLLDSASRVPQQSAEVINGLIAQGMLFTVATARSWSSASLVTSNLNLSLPVATYNGAFLVDPANGRIIESGCFERAQAEHVLNTFLESGIRLLVYAFIDGQERVSWVGGSENEGVLHYLTLRRGDRRLRRVEQARELFAGDIFYFTAIGSQEELAPFAGRFADGAVYSHTFQQERPNKEYWLEVKRADATKAVAIEKLKRLTGAGRVVCFGDSLNDLPMFAAADEAYAVANAAPALLAAATGVIGCDDDGAVARWLIEHAGIYI